MTKRKKAVVSVAALVLALALLVTAGALWLLVRDKTEVYRDNEPFRYVFGLNYETLNHTADDADRETAQAGFGSRGKGGRLRRLPGGFSV